MIFPGVTATVFPSGSFLHLPGGSASLFVQSYLTACEVPAAVTITGFAPLDA